MILTDTHTHLYIDAFKQDRKQVVRRAIEAGVHRFFIPAIDSTYTKAMYDLEKQFPEHVFLMAGLHPTSVKENYKQELERVETMLASRKFYGVGEIGIDLYWDRTFFKQQQEAFAHQIRLAEEYKLPIIIHCRESFDEIIEVIDEVGSGELRGIFHCFTGSLEQAHMAIERNMKLGIGGVVTFKNGKIDRYLSEIDLSHIVIETDSPYLAPTPFRGKRNESSYLLYILDKLVEIYGRDREDIARITTENSINVFGI